MPKNQHNITTNHHRPFWDGNVRQLYPGRIHEISQSKIDFSKIKEDKPLLIFSGIFYILVFLSFNTVLITFAVLFVAPVIVAVGLFRNSIHPKKIEKNNHAILSEFAAHNSLGYNPKTKIKPSDFFRYKQVAHNDGTNQSTQKRLTSAGSLFEFTKSMGTKYELSGYFSGLPFMIFEYSFQRLNLGSQFNNQPRKAGHIESEKLYSCLVMAIQLPRSMPHLVVDSLIESHGVIQPSALPIAFDRSQRMQLSGNFYKSFDVYSCDSNAITNLAILTPDVMEILQDHAHQYDMEIIDNTFYLYRGTAASGDEILNIYRVAEKLFAKIGRKLTTANILTSKETSKHLGLEVDSTHQHNPRSASAADSTKKSLKTGDRNILTKILRYIFTPIFFVSITIGILAFSYISLFPNSAYFDLIENIMAISLMIAIPAYFMYWLTTKMR